MPKVLFEIKLPVRIKKKTNIYVSSCDVLDIHSQGNSEEEAKQNLIEALKLFITTCFERGTLDAALKDCGFQVRKIPMKFPFKHQDFVTVPIPFNARGTCLSECRV